MPADLNELVPIPATYFSSGRQLPPVEPGKLITTDDSPLLEYYLWRSLSNDTPKVLTGHLWHGTVRD